MLTVVPKLSDRVINGELLRYLAKTASDEQPGIRTNTTICLGKISKNLGSSTRTKVLIAAFGRALKDPFVHARNAALMALAATSDVYSDEDCATKILPGICPSLIDKERMIRDQANKTMDIFFQRVKKYSATLPDTVQPPPNAAAANPPRMGTPSNEGSSWAGWAISSFTNKITTVNGQMSTENGNAEAAPRSSSLPPANTGLTRPAPTTSKTQTTSTQNLPSIKSVKPNPFAAVETFNEPIEPEEDFTSGWGEEEEANPWGGDGDEDPFSARTPSKTSMEATYDDKGEPDFEGWLNAQSKSKITSKKPLPRGLAKTAAKNLASRPAIGKSSSTGNVTARKIVVAKPVVKKETPKPAEEEIEAEGWGDEWS